MTKANAKANRLAATLEHLGFSPSSLTQAVKSDSKTKKKPQSAQQNPASLEESLEWIFAIDSNIIPFLEWISDAFGSNVISPLDDLSAEKRLANSVFGYHVLTEDELLAYEEIKAAGLVNTQHNSDIVSEEFDWYFETDDDIEKEIADLANELEDLQEYAHILEKQESSLRFKKEQLQQQTSDCIHEEASISNKIMNQTAALENLSTKLNVTTKGLCEIINKVIACASLDQSESILTINDTAEYYLFQNTENLASFIREDEVLSENLISFYETEFDSRESVQTNEYFSYESAEVRKDYLKEMERLTELHALTEQQYLDAYLALKFAQKKLACFQEFSVDSLENLTQIRASTKMHHQASKSLHASIHNMIQTRLKPLWTESAEQSVKTLILQTDYAAKVARQSHLLNGLEKFVGLLLSQQSRHQFLAIAFETEVAMLKRVAHILESVVEELEAKYADFQQRMDWYKIPQFACDKLPNRLIDGRDELMKEIMRDLDMDETTKEHAVSSIVFSSIDTVIAKAKSLVQEVRVSEKKCSFVESARRAIVKDVAQANNDLLQMLHQFTSTTQPIDAPQEWYTMQYQFRNTVNELQPLLKSAAKDVDYSKRIIEHRLASKL